MNTVTLVGNLTRDPEIEVKQETRVCRMRVAANGSKDGPLFIDVTTFGRQAEACSRYLAKGRPVALSGRLRFREWRAKDGARRSEHSIIAERVDFLAPREEASLESSDSGQEIGSTKK
jgi:single-strand DNA-binding protein